jgi:hypothetical protein
VRTINRWKGVITAIARKDFSADQGRHADDLRGISDVTCSRDNAEIQMVIQAEDNRGER